MTNDKKTSPARTKGPWRLAGPHSIDIDGGNQVRGMLVMNADERFGYSFPIARVTGPAYIGSEDECDPELLANAEFIVRACNAHVESCRRLEAALGKAQSRAA
jgi:hypothetical protein